MIKRISKRNSYKYNEERFGINYKIMEEALARKHTTRRRAIVEALATELEQINGSSTF